MDQVLTELDSKQKHPGWFHYCPQLILDWAHSLSLWRCSFSGRRLKAFCWRFPFTSTLVSRTTESLGKAIELRRDTVPLQKRILPGPLSVPLPSTTVVVRFQKVQTTDTSSPEITLKLQLVECSSANGRLQDRVYRKSMKRQTTRSLAVRCAHRYSTVMGHSSGQCTNGQDAEEDDYEPYFLSASCLSCKKHTDVDGRDRAANTLPDQPLEPDMTSPFLKIEYAIGLFRLIKGGAQWPIG